jgi:hypothetical protein
MIRDSDLIPHSDGKVLWNGALYHALYKIVTLFRRSFAYFWVTMALDGGVHT